MMSSCLFYLITISFIDLFLFLHFFNGGRHHRVGGSEDSLQELVLSFGHVGSRESNSGP